ncbi:MAG TPA: GNAT family N-acetyltransferase [Anaerolineales bacterium]|nr:GNAT family N-acetyltransferase [Anaerolineales bacterium]HNO85622.1 GNAT family N-acetyltransferase [Anaerolineales bacterium]
MSKESIRPALESESAQIKDLINLVGINPTGLDWKRFVVTVNDSGQVIACGQIKPHGTDIRELASIAVHPDHRGKGLARAVIEVLLEQTERPVYLMCIAHNGPMYEKFGFHTVSDDQMPKYFKRIKNLFDVAVLFRKTEENLLVMKLE